MSHQAAEFALSENRPHHAYAIQCGLFSMDGKCAGLHDAIPRWVRPLGDRLQMSLEVPQDRRLPRDAIAAGDLGSARLDVDKGVRHHVDMGLRVNPARDGKARELEVRSQLLTRVGEARHLLLQ